MRCEATQAQTASASPKDRPAASKTKPFSREALWEGKSLICFHSCVTRKCHLNAPAWTGFLVRTGIDAFAHLIVDLLQLRPLRLELEWFVFTSWVSGTMDLPTKEQVIPSKFSFGCRKIAVDLA